MQTDEPDQSSTIIKKQVDIQVSSTTVELDSPSSPSESFASEGLSRQESEASFASTDAVSTTSSQEITSEFFENIRKCLNKCICSILDNVVLKTNHYIYTRTLLLFLYLYPYLKVQATSFFALCGVV